MLILAQSPLPFALTVTADEGLNPCLIVCLSATNFMLYFVTSGGGGTWLQKPIEVMGGRYDVKALIQLTASTPRIQQCLFSAADARSERLVRQNEIQIQFVCIERALNAFKDWMSNNPQTFELMVKESLRHESDFRQMEADLNESGSHG